MNLLKKLVGFIKNGPNKNKYDEEREDFYHVSTRPEFVDYQNKILQKIYFEYELLALFDKKYPIVIHEAKENFSYPLKENLLRFSKLTSTEIPKFDLDKTQKHYYNIMGPTIKRPDMVGFEIDEIFLDEDSKVEGFSAKVCQYKHNVVTSPILDYELLK
ncbi:hypothetical protein [Paenisporosarcina indica]|uniref:hypothetical protein n=1 Tax=Paenisporosarcina indica TaxID=650093 RepID=UPI00094F906A|nr:hypothetical protein [Paenisporosarcina indica]